MNPSAVASGFWETSKSFLANNVNIGSSITISY